ncbi:MAG TPA: hypothetical protein P5509_05010 [Bacteroidales bacterium]|nr:hypothetical protein [Bacteroidales bacterium]
MEKQYEKDLFSKDFLKRLGFEITKDDGQYGKAESIRPKGKILLSWNRDGAHCDYFGTPITEYNAFFGVEEDGGTRTAFNGIVYSEQDIERILKLTY